MEVLTNISNNYIDSITSIIGKDKLIQKLKDIIDYIERK